MNLMRFQVRFQLMQGWITGYESVAKQPNYYMLHLWINISGPKHITEYVFWKMYLLTWISFRNTVCSSLGFTTLIQEWFHTSVSNLGRINRSGVDILFLGMTQRSRAFLWWDPWRANHGPPLIVYFVFTYRLDLEIFKRD